MDIQVSAHPLSMFSRTLLWLERYPVLYVYPVMYIQMGQVLKQ